MMNIVGVDSLPSGIVFRTNSDTRIATCLTYINEFVHVFRKSGSEDATFTYVIKDGAIVGEWTPSILNYTTVGQIMCAVDNYLKTIFIELSAINSGIAVMDAFHKKPPFKHLYLRGINIQPRKISYTEFGRGISIDDVTFELKYWQKDAATGMSVPFNSHELDYLRYYEHEFMPNIMRSYPEHPFNHLKQVIVAQQIAKHLVKNTPYTIDESYIDKTPSSVSIPIHIRSCSVTMCVYGEYEGNFIVCCQHRHSNRWHIITMMPTKTTTWRLINELGVPTSGDTTTVTTESNSEGGVILSGRTELERRGAVSDDRSGGRPGMGFKFVVFADDNKKCSALKTIFNSTLYNSVRFDTDAETIGQLAIDSFKNAHILKTYPAKIEKFCDPHY